MALHSRNKNKIFLTKIAIQFVYIVGLTNCYPITSASFSKNNPNEKKYPNGTVVGKYTYLDEDGAPVHVKYFADDSSYGVELKSFKTVGLDKDFLTKTNRDPEFDLFYNNNNVPDAKALDIYNKLNFPSGTENIGRNKQGEDPYDTERKYTKQNAKSARVFDYDVYVGNDLMNLPKKCSKEKLRVYGAKNTRKV